MNVMKKAHELTRQVFACSGSKGLIYKNILAAALRDLHRIAKAGGDISKISI